MTRHSRLFAAALLTLSAATAACGADDRVPVEVRTAIADTLRALVINAYDLTLPDAGARDAPARLLSLYPDSGRLISAAAGEMTTTRAALETEIRGFWQRVGRHMQEPRFLLGSSYVDVLTRDAAVMTFRYAIPHRTPAGMPHTVRGAWTALWRRQGGRWVIVQEHLSDAPDTVVAAPSAPPADSSPPMTHRH